MLYAFFWVIPRRLYFIFRRFGTLCLFHLHRQVDMKDPSYLSTYEDGTDSVPKRRHIKCRRRGITQKKAYNMLRLPYEYYVACRSHVQRLTVSITSILPAL